MPRRFVAAFSILAAACGPPQSSQQSGPSAVPQSFAISGVVTSRGPAGTAPMARARVEIVGGSSLGRRTDTDGDGRYRLDGIASGQVLVRATAAGHLAAIDGVLLDRDRTLDLIVQLASISTRGRLIDGVTRSGISDVAIAGSVAPAWTNGDGSFEAAIAAPATSPLAITFTHDGFVARSTFVTVPGPEVEWTMMPRSFSVAAFDEFCRTPALRRWLVPPHLIVYDRALQFTNASADEFVATGVELTADEVEDLVTHMSTVLPLLTGGALPAFASIRRERVGAGARVPFLNDGAITVARFVGLRAASGFGGYGRWQTAGAGEVVGGAILLDEAADRNETSRRGLRTHELGHALGYQHVTLVPSVMHPSAGALSPFDLHAARLAFDRPPGNRTPDIDPAPEPAGLLALSRRWSEPIR